MKKISFAFLSVFLIHIILLLTACGVTNELNVYTLKGPTGMGMVKLMEDNNDYNYTLASTPDEVTAAIISGEADIAAVPINLASVLYNKTNGGVKVIAINTLGVLHILENGNTVHSIQDLKGKTLYATGQGSTPEYILNYLLAANGLNPETDLEIIYLADHSELATLMASGEVTLGMLPEPNVTTAQMNNQDLRRALDLTAEWDKVSGGTKLAQGVIIARSNFIESNNNAVKSFLKNYKASVEYVNSHVAEAAVLIEKQGIVAKAAIAEKALPGCNITYIDADEMRENYKAFINILFEANPKSVGGALPNEDFYYINK